MPQLSDILEKRKDKKFVKKNYRPWDLTGSNSESLISEINLNNPIQEQSIQNANNLIEIDIYPQPNKIESYQQIDNNRDNILDNKKVTNGEQLDNRKVTNREQLDHKYENNQVTIREQLDNEISAISLKKRYQKLSGIQRKILDFVFEICLSRGAIETGPIETQIISKYINATYGSTKTSIIRLINKGFLERLAGKTAKGGFINLKLPDAIKKIIVECHSETLLLKKPLELLNSLKNNLDNKIDNNLLHISSNNNINTTKGMPYEWENINLEPLAPIGFGKTQIFQLYEKKLNLPEIIQESINHFAFGLENNTKIKEYSNPLNVLMGVLRKGQNWTEPNYESPQEVALRKIVEEKKKRKEKEDALINELIDIEFPTWERSLNSEELEKILPPEMLNTRFIGGKQSLLRNYFKEKILIPKLNNRDFIGDS